MNDDSQQKKMDKFFSYFAARIPEEVNTVEVFNRKGLAIYNNIEAKSAITYNKTHMMLENTGPELLIDDLNEENVMSALRECRRDKSCYLTDDQCINVRSCINSDRFFSGKVDGIFIHDSFKGLVSIKKKGSTGENVASVHV